MRRRDVPVQSGSVSIRALRQIGCVKHARCLLSNSALIFVVNAKHLKTLVAIFAHPALASIPCMEIEALIKSLGGTIAQREGSRPKIELKGEQWRCHRPHPGKEAKRYQVEEARELLERTGLRP